MTATTLPSALPASPYALTVTPSKTPTAPDGTVHIRISGPHSAEWVNADDLRDALDKIDPPKTTNQERNRGALIEHIAEQDRIIRRRNEQISGLVERIEQAEGDLARYRAMHSEQIKTIARLQENPRALTADAIEVAIHDCMPKAALDRLNGTQVMQLAEDMYAALTEPPARPEGAEKVEAVLNQYWSGDINGDDLADRIVEEMNR